MKTKFTIFFSIKMFDMILHPWFNVEVKVYHVYVYDCNVRLYIRYMTTHIISYCKNQ